jgi:hypothetical protein
MNLGLRKSHCFLDLLPFIIIITSIRLGRPRQLNRTRAPISHGEVTVGLRPPSDDADDSQGSRADWILPRFSNCLSPVTLE